MLILLLAGTLKTPKLMGLFFLALSLIPGYYALMIVYTVRFVKKLQRTGVQAAGFIISQREVQSARGGSFDTYLIPKVRFQTLDGINIEGESRGGHSEVEFYDGQEAYVFYDATRPAHFLFVQELAPAYSTYLLMLVAMLLAIGMVWGGLKLLFT